MGFSRQEYWSGLPCPPPGDLPNPAIEPSLLHCRKILYHLSHQGSPRILEWVAYPSPGDLPDSGIELGSPALQADSLPAWLPGKPTEMLCYGNTQIWQTFKKIKFQVRNFHNFLRRCLLMCTLSLVQQPVWPHPICLIKKGSGQIVKKISFWSALPGFPPKQFTGNCLFLD